MKRKISFILCILVILGSVLSGCSKDGNEKESWKKDGEQTEKEQKTGRYMEKDVPLPQLEGEDSIIQIVENPEKQIEVYTIQANGKDTSYGCYRMKEDQSWEKEEPGWLNEGKAEIGKDAGVAMVRMGGDGNYYAVYVTYENGMRYQLVVSRDGGKTAEALEIPYFNEVVTEIDENEYYPYINDLAVMENGTIVLYDMFKDNTLQVFDQEGKKLSELKISREQNFIVSGNSLLLMNEDETAVMRYDTVGKKEEKAWNYDFEMQKDGYIVNVTYAIKEDGTLLLADQKGIHRIGGDGTLWETTVDGSLNSMSMPDLSIQSLFVSGAEQEAYYVAYTGSDGYQLKYYEFNSDVSAVPGTEITVYSLKESATIRQAISLYQSEHTDTKVNYVVAMGDGGENVSDYIRSLNTELLAGNGADVLVLDGLPVDSYIEKGVLADISDVIRPLADTLLENITGSFIEENGVYRLPLRFTVPIIIGKKNAIPDMERIENIAAYIEQTKNEPLTAPRSFRRFIADYLTLYQKELFQEGNLSEEELNGFLKNLKIIAENIKAEETIEGEGVNSNVKNLFLDKDDLFGGGIFSLVAGKSSCSMGQIRNVSDTIIPYAAGKKVNTEFESMGQKYLPNGMVGLNKASGQTETAKDFITFLFSDKVQSTNLYDGFPVNKTAFKDWIEEENNDIMLGITDDDGGELTGEWPTLEERMNLQEIIMNTNEPIETNQILSDMIADEILAYLKGERSAEQTAAAIKTKVNTYMSE